MSEDFNNDHPALVTDWTLLQRGTRQFFVECRVIVINWPIAWRRLRINSRHPQQLTAESEFFFSVTVTEEAIVTDPLESFRKDMNQKSPNEFIGRQGHRLLSVVVAVIVPMKSHSAILDIE